MKSGEDVSNSVETIPEESTSIQVSRQNSVVPKLDVK